MGVDMRHSIVVGCASALFLLCFAALYLLLHGAQPSTRAIVGGGLFFLLALGMLWKDSVRVTARPRGDAAGRERWRISTINS
jgi:hypothetical protein